MERQNSTKVRQPGKQMLHFATSLVTTQSPAVLSERVVSIRPMRGNHFDPSLLELGVKFVAVAHEVTVVQDTVEGQFVSDTSERLIGDTA